MALRRTKVHRWKNPQETQPNFRRSGGIHERTWMAELVFLPWAFWTDHRAVEDKKCVPLTSILTNLLSQLFVVYAWFLVVYRRLGGDIIRKSFRVVRVCLRFGCLVRSGWKLWFPFFCLLRWVFYLYFYFIYFYFKPPVSFYSILFPTLQVGVVRIQSKIHSFLLVPPPPQHQIKRTDTDPTYPRQLEPQGASAAHPKCTPVFF